MTTQVKFTIELDIVDAFKARCAADGVSMASVIKMWMKARQPIKDVKVKLSTRLGRKNAVAEYIRSLSAVLENEEQYRDQIPEQFEQRIETAGYSCERLEEAIALLQDAY